ncbi:MAG: DUF2203 family protein [Actinomycetota bacterium]
MTEERTFTKDEADAMLPDLRVRLERIRSNRQVLLRAAERIRGQMASDGGGHFGNDYWQVSRALKEVVEALAEQNVLLRDPQTGLIDFPGEREGRPVFLCWQLGEDAVAHWHEVESGFLGRRPL